MTKLDIGEEHIISLLGLTFIFLWLAEYTGYAHVWKSLKSDFSRPVFVVLAGIALVIILIGSNSDKRRVREATHLAMSALIVSYFSHLNMVFPAFFLVGITTYIALDPYTQG
jgi:hypothetical protein